MLKKLLIVWILCFTTYLAAELQVFVDINRFFDKDKNTIFEINYEIPYKYLDFLEKDSTYVALIKTEMLLLKNNKSVYNKNYTNQISLRDEDSIESETTFKDKITLTLSKSGFALRLNFLNLHSNEKFAFEEKLNILNRNKLISDIEFSLYISRDSLSMLEKFVRENYLFYPTTRHLYNLPYHKRIYLFYEVYNEVASHDETLTVYKGNKKILEKNKTIGNENLFAIQKRITSLDIASMEEGYYKLVVEIESENNSEKVEDNFLIKEEKIRYQSIFLDLEDEYKLVRYFLSSNQKTVYKNLTSDEARKNFLSRFWISEDPNPLTKENEFMNLVENRIKYTNRHFSAFKDGWKTDRGRIYIKYGEPDDIKNYRTGLNTKFVQKEYQVWKYRIEKHFTYIFIDMQTTGNYKLIYSENDNSETTRPNWRSYLGEDFDESVLQ